MQLIIDNEYQHSGTANTTSIAYAVSVVVSAADTTDILASTTTTHTTTMTKSATKELFLYIVYT